MINNLEFAYVEGQRKDESNESAMRLNIYMWLGPLEEEINKKNIVVSVVFLSQDKRDLFLSGADADLQVRFTNRMREFEI